MLRKLVLRAVVMIISIVAVVILVVVINPHMGGVERASFSSPGGDYKAVIYVYSLPTVAMPGQGSDRDGFARVFNARGRLLCEMDIPLAGQVDEHAVRWFPKSVSLPGREGFEDCPLQ